MQRLSLVLCVFALAAGCRKKGPETEFKLDNGLRVELAPSADGDEVALVVVFDVGADHDPAGRSGMAHLIERLFATMGREGKPNRTVQTRTGADFTYYGLAVPTARLNEELDDTVLRMSTLAPTEADLARERQRLLEQVATMQEKDPLMAAMNKASESLRPSAGGGIRGGVAAEIQAMTFAEIEAFRRAHYGAATARLVIAGRFDLAEVSKRVRSAFSAVPAGKAPQARSPAGSRVTGTPGDGRPAERGRARRPRARPEGSGLPGVRRAGDAPGDERRAHLEGQLRSARTPGHPPGDQPHSSGPAARGVCTRRCAPT